MDPSKIRELLEKAGPLYLGRDVDIVLDELAQTLTDSAPMATERTYARVRLGLEGLKNYCEGYALRKVSEYGGGGR